MQQKSYKNDEKKICSHKKDKHFYLHTISNKNQNKINEYDIK